MKKLFRVFSVAILAAIVATLVGITNPAFADTTTTTVPVLVSVTTTTTIYDAPNTSADNMGSLVAGQTWFVLGMDTTGKWVQVLITQAGLSGWAPASDFNLSGLNLPVIGETGGSTVATPTAAAPAAPPVVPGTVLTVPVLLTVANTATVYDAPTTSGDIVGSIVAGQTWFVLGIDSTGQWIKFQITNGGVQGWVPASAFSLGNYKLPVTD